MNKIHKEPTSAEIKRLNKLKETIEHHRYNYHVLNKEEISAEALDSLKKELADIERRYPELISPDSPSQRVAGKPLSEFRKVPHRVAQWSFNDAFDEDEILEFDARVKRFLKSENENVSDLSYTCELKIDGLKVVLTYENGYLITAATRGDGKIGEDVTENVKTIESVPLRLKSPEDVIVEGEVWMGKDDLKKLNELRRKREEPIFANPRNAAAGGIRQLDPAVARSRNLDTFIYDLAASIKKIPPTQFDELEYLRVLGFKVNPHFALCGNIDEVVEYWKKWMN